MQLHPEPSIRGRIGPLDRSGALKLATRTSARAICPFCRDGLGASSDAIETCGGCGALYHADCLRLELRGACAVLGCGGASQAPAPRRRGSQRSTCISCERGFVTETPESCARCGAPHHHDCILDDGRCKRPDCGAELLPRWNRLAQPFGEEEAQGDDPLKALLVIGAVAAALLGLGQLRPALIVSLVLLWGWATERWEGAQRNRGRHHGV